MTELEDTRIAQLKQLAEDGDECAAADLYKEDPQQDELTLTKEAERDMERDRLRSRVVAIDFETRYTRDYSVTTAGVDAYCRDARFDAWLVAIVGPHFGEWVGHPKEAPWDLINGQTWLSHNVAFDSAVFRRLQADGVVPATIRPAAWHCTADLCAYFQAPRALGAAAKVLLDKTLDKAARTAMREN